GLQREALEGEIDVKFGRSARLREYELELVARPDAKLGPGLRAHAHPIELRGQVDRAVGLDRHLEAAGMQGIEQAAVDLQQRLASGQHDEPPPSPACPLLLDRLSELLGRAVAAAARSVGADEIRVAELASRGRAIRLPPGPQVTPCESAEHRRAAGVRSLALQRQKDLLDRVAHAQLS